MKKITMFVLLLTATITASAQQIGVTEALGRAQQFLHSKSKHMKAAGVNRNSLQLAYSADTQEGTAFYVFNQNEDDGFVIVGADELCRPVLGYSEHGSFDIDKLPDNVRWWLSQYSEQFCQVKKLGAKAEAQTREKQQRQRAAKASIAPLMTTRWNQGEPFNNAIPTLGPGYSKFVTGCVATAMAQVMKYHNTPAQGSGSHDYTITYNSTMPVNFSADFGSTNYDWANMLDDYNGGYNSTQANAVATLMYHAGVSVDMNYNTSTNGGSGAQSNKIPNALYTYFGYDKSAYEANRNFYADEEWEDLIYGELAANRPVLYGGQDYKGGGGHQFVCHGYNAADDMYAFNWGWGGYCDGYYAMTGANGTGVLQPNGNGIGGAGTEAAYTVGQTAAINVMPDQGGDYYYQIAAFDGFRAYTPNGSEFSSTTIGAENGKFCIGVKPMNASSVETSFYLGVAFRNIVTDEMLYSDTQVSGGPLRPGYYYSNDWSIDFTPSVILRNGEYEIIPTFRTNSAGEWKPLLVEASQVYPVITVTGRALAEKVDVNFEISGTTVSERMTLAISHDELYDGTITYKSSDESVATVSAEGVVTAVHEGTATITAEAEERPYFNATTKTFDITVTPFEPLPVNFQISSTEIEKNGTAQITWNEDYTGTVSFTVAPQGIVSVSNAGLVTALASGTATVTATATAAGDYKATQIDFDVTVPDEYVEGIMISDFKVANNGYVTPTTVKYDYTVTNMLNTDNDVKINMEITNGYFTGTSSLGLGLPANYVYPTSTDLSGWSSYFGNYTTNASQFTLRFLNSDKTKAHKVDGQTEFTLVMCNDLTIDYAMTDAGWGTISLPFEAEVPAGLTAYAASNVAGNYLTLEEVDFLEMGTPYIVSGTAGTYRFDGPDVPYSAPTVKSGMLTGVVGDNVGLKAGDYIMQNQGGAVGFYRLAKDITKPATKYRAFVRLEEGSSLAGNACFIIPGTDSADGIDAVNADEETQIFDLSGRRINGVMRGINIIKNSDGSTRRVLVP